MLAFFCILKVELLYVATRPLRSDKYGVRMVYVQLKRNAKLLCLDRSIMRCGFIWVLQFVGCCLLCIIPVHTSTHTHTHTQKHTHIHTHTHTCMHTHMHIYTHTHKVLPCIYTSQQNTHTHTHTHNTPTQRYMTSFVFVLSLLVSQQSNGLISPLSLPLLPLPPSSSHLTLNYARHFAPIFSTRCNADIL